MPPPAPHASALILDFDGVIVHSEPLHLRALREALRESIGSRADALTDALYYERFVAYADADVLPLVASALSLEWNETLQASTLARKHALFERLVAAGEVGTFAGTLALIEACTQQRVPLACCSAATGRDIRHALTRLSVLDAFATIVAYEDVPRSKPDPAPYLLACQRLGLAPASCVAIEDTPGGVNSAIDAGLRVLAVCHTVSAERLQRAHRVVPTTTGLSLVDVLAT